MSRFVSSQIQGQIPRAKCTNPTIHPGRLIWAITTARRTAANALSWNLDLDCLRSAARYDLVSFLSICGLADNLERGWQRAYPSIGAQLHLYLALHLDPSPSAYGGAPTSTRPDVYLASAQREGVLHRGTSTGNRGRDALQAIRSRTKNSVQPAVRRFWGRGKEYPAFR
ncbi:hypothetical protein N431DRAFT_533228 [Stipitochalara longipes BDJ]|nr:hypothetical protein N431DRAFT_533228 [Stipitochalara longipes BDJ]